MKISAKNLKKPMAEGAEGIVYDYDGAHVLKIYKDHIALEGKEKKLQCLVHKKLPDSVIKPLELVYRDNDKFCGFLMKKIAGEELRSLGNKKFITANNITKKIILGMLVQIRETLKILHGNQVYVGDLNDRNILFDQSYQVFFIDVDSWSVEQYPCEVVMDLYMDPLLKGVSFNADTDSFAYSILSFKSLTRLHPYGGIMDPDIDILTRMKKGLSVLDLTNLTIPKTVDHWNFFYPDYTKELKTIFTHQQRKLSEETLDFFKDHLEFCKIHNNHYFSQFDGCPVCDANAQIISVPLDAETQILQSKGGIPYRILFTGEDVKVILNENVYLNQANEVVIRRTGRKTPYERGNLYDFQADILFTVQKDQIIIEQKEERFVFEKIHGSAVSIAQNNVFYIGQNSALNWVQVLGGGNTEKQMEKVSLNSLFQVVDTKNYLLCHPYQDFKIINNSGYHYELKNSDKIINYGIHLDQASGYWLFIYENEKGIFNTFVFEKNKLVYHNERKRYYVPLSHLCFHQKTIFYSSDNKMIGFHIEKNAQKEFEVPYLNDETMLIRRGTKFIALGEKAILEIG